MKRPELCLVLAGLVLTACGTEQPAAGILDFNPPARVLERLRTERKPFVEAWSDTPSRPSFTVLQFSDLHGDAENLSRIVEFSEACAEGIDEVLHTGDVVPCYWDEANPWNTVPGAARFLNTVGNHDCWKGHLVWSQTNRPYDASQEDAYSLVMAGEDPSRPFVSLWNVSQPAGVGEPSSPHYCACYYYKDYEAPAIRLIVLDCMHYTPVQDEWFDATLQDALGKGLTVVAVQHYPPQPGLDKIESGFSDPDYDIPPTPGTPGLQLECMPDEAFSTADRFISAGGTFACWLSGHLHGDMLGHVSGHLRQLHISVDKAGEGDRYMQEDRTRGTSRQDSFNLVTVNPSRGVLFIDRIGCNRDQYMRPKTLFCYDYINGKILLNQ